MRHNQDPNILASSLRNGRGLALTLDPSLIDKTILQDALGVALRTPSEYADISGFSLLYAKVMIKFSLDVKAISKLLKSSNFLSSSLIIATLGLIAKTGDKLAQDAILDYIQSGDFWELALNQACTNDLPGLDQLEEVITERLLVDSCCPPVGLKELVLAALPSKESTPAPSETFTHSSSAASYLDPPLPPGPCSKLYYGEASKAASYLWAAPREEALTWARRFKEDPSERHILARSLLLNLGESQDAEFFKGVISSTLESLSTSEFASMSSLRDDAYLRDDALRNDRSSSDASWCDAADALNKLQELDIALDPKTAKQLWEHSPYPYVRSLALSSLDALDFKELIAEGIHDGDPQMREFFIENFFKEEPEPQLKSSLRSPLEPSWIQKLLN